MFLITDTLLRYKYDIGTDVRRIKTDDIIHDGSIPLPILLCEYNGPELSNNHLLYMDSDVFELLREVRPLADFVL